VLYVGSMAKQFTAAGIRLLEHRGSLRLEDDVRKYVPELPAYDRPIRIRHLLFHTSGLRDYLELLALSGRSFEDPFDNATALALIVGQRHLNFSPGSAHLYSNSNYLLLAKVIERVSGRSLRQFTTESFFAPLGMRQTHFADDRREIVRHRAHGYRLVPDQGYRRYA
jgi:CubicO group peptidase (beta-lactamase class C family)